MKKLIMSLAVMAFMFLLSAPCVMAQCDQNNPPCEGDFDCDCDVDGSDAAGFKSDFGRSGFNFPCPPCLGSAPVPKTGMTTSEGTGDDGDLERGVTWPNPRFLDNLDGTIKDNLTGLIWLKNANCFGQRTWSQALSDCNGLASGQCDLTDSSNVGDWRLPNIKEMQSLIHFGYINPSVPNTAGTGKCRRVIHSTACSRFLTGRPLPTFIVPSMLGVWPYPMVTIIYLIKTSPSSYCPYEAVNKRKERANFQ